MEINPTLLLVLLNKKNDLKNSDQPGNNLNLKMTLRTFNKSYVPP